jgi:catechol 2,3-dioxygenase-like lactoylglutathione lyase family enzyme
MGGLRMANDTRINSAVMFVQELNRSVSFYQDVLGLEVVDRSPTAVLLMGSAGTQLVLRSMGGNAQHPLGGVGVQYVVWTASSKDDLDRCEKVLKERSAYTDSRSGGEVRSIEGRDPDGITLAIIYPGPEQVPQHELWTRIYAW